LKGEYFMEPDYIARGIAPYDAEIANIRYFFRQKRTMNEWQDWLWRRMPKLRAVTTKLPPYAIRLGTWGAGKTPDLAVRYTDLLTYMVMAGMIVRERLPHTTTYEVAKPIDKVAKPSYSQGELPY
jgi:hypothetical protein